MSITVNKRLMSKVYRPSSFIGSEKIKSKIYLFTQEQNTSDSQFNGFHNGTKISSNISNEENCKTHISDLNEIVMDYRIMFDKKLE